MNRGYYMNGLKALRTELARRHKLATARFCRMDVINHPDADDQLLFCDLLARMERLVETEQSKIAISSGMETDRA